MRGERNISHKIYKVAPNVVDGAAHVVAQHENDVINVRVVVDEELELRELPLRCNPRHLVDSKRIDSSEIY